MFIPLHDANHLRHIRKQYVTIGLIAANVIVYLASDGADHLCGVNIPVDGGLTAWNGQPNQEK